MEFLYIYAIVNSTYVFQRRMKCLKVFLCLIGYTNHFVISFIHPSVDRSIPLPIASAIGSGMLGGDEHHRAYHTAYSSK